MERLYSVGIDVTRKCTLRCLHCYNYSGEERVVALSEMNDDELFHTAKSVLSMKPESLCLCGGEPLLRRDILLKIAKYGKEYFESVHINMVSNGELITKQIAKQIVSAGFNSVQISLDGAKAETHDWMRNKVGVYEKAIAAIQYLNEEKLKQNSSMQISVAFCPNRKNYDELQNAVDICEKLGVNIFKVQPMMMIGRAKQYLAEYVFTQKEYRDFIKMIRKMKDTITVNKWEIRIDWGDPIDHLLMEDVLNLTFFQVGANGGLFLTPYIPLSIGNLLKHDFQDYCKCDLNAVWNHKLYAYLRKIIYTPEKMNLNSIIPDIPEIGTGELYVDILEEHWKEQMDVIYSKIKGKRKDEY